MAVTRLSPHSVRLDATRAISLPMRCVVCDSPQIVWVKYVRNTGELIKPGFGVAEWLDNMHLPYCKRHASRFRRRFFWLQFSQVAVFFLTVGMFALFSWLRSETFIWVLVSFLVSVLIWLFISLAVMPRLLHDLIVTSYSNFIHIKCNSSAFIDAIVSENQPE